LRKYGEISSFAFTLDAISPFPSPPPVDHPTVMSMPSVWASTPDLKKIFVFFPFVKVCSLSWTGHPFPPATFCFSDPPRFRSSDLFNVPRHVHLPSAPPLRLAPELAPPNLTRVPGWLALKDELSTSPIRGAASVELFIFRPLPLSAEARFPLPSLTPDSDLMEEGRVFPIVLFAPSAFLPPSLP